VTDLASTPHTDPLLRHTGPGAHRIAELTAAWLLAKRSAHTRTAYRRDLAAWLSWCADTRRDPLHMRIADVDTWIVAQRHHEGAADSSIARRVSAISSWYTYLVANTAEDPVPLVTHNPTRAASRPRPDPDDSTTVGLARAEADRLLAEADTDGPGSSALIRLLLTAGLRVGSAINARVEDLGHDRGHRVLDVTVKRNKRRRVPLPPVVANAVEAMLTARGAPATGPLFVTGTGKPIYELHVYRLIKRLARSAGIATADRLSPHSLRHTAITELLDASGGDLRRAQDFADHADPRTTRRYDRARHNLDNHGAYLLAARFASPNQ
jgi:integrase/recombinase XerD